MRTQPTWRIPFGVLCLCIGLIAYGLVIARYVPDLIAPLPTWTHIMVYLVLGVIWLLPLKRFLIWMETGRWSPPETD